MVCRVCVVLWEEKRCNESCEGNGVYWGLSVVEELRERVWPGQNLEVVVQPSSCGGAFGGLQIPLACDLGLNLLVPNIVILNSHPVPTQVAESLNPRILKCWERLEKKGHHHVGKLDEGNHVIKICRESVAEKLEESMDGVTPEPRRHSIFMWQALHRGGSERMLRCKEEIMVFVKR